MGISPLVVTHAPLAAPPAISCSGFFHNWSFLGAPPLGLPRRSREPHTHSKIYSNESLMTLEGNQQAQEGLQRFSFRTQRFFQTHLWKTNWGRREPVHTESSSGNTQGPCTCWGDGDGAARRCWQSCRSTDSGAGACGLLSHLGSVPTCWARRRREGCSGGAGDGEEGTERRAGQREAATSGLFAAIQKTREIGSLFH